MCLMDANGKSKSISLKTSVIMIKKEILNLKYSSLDAKELKFLLNIYVLLNSVLGCCVKCKVNTLVHLKTRFILEGLKFHFSEWTMNFSLLIISMEVLICHSCLLWTFQNLMVQLKTLNHFITPKNLYRISKQQLEMIRISTYLITKALLQDCLIKIEKTQAIKLYALLV